MKKQGLSKKEVLKRLEKYGENKLKPKKKVGWLKVLVDQFKSPLIYILLIASGITFGLGDIVDAGVIGAAVILNTVLGFYQEMKAERSLEALSELLTPKTKVIREGSRQVVEASQVVPGDVCVLEIGERVPADGVLIKADSMSFNEAILTGESAPVKKKIKEKVFMGTIVNGGIGLMEAERTGHLTEIGKIASKLTETKEEKTPLQKQIAKFSSKLAVMVGIISAIILVVGLMVGDEFVEIFTTAVAVAVSAIPEGLAVSLTVILAIGMQRIFKRKSLVRKLVAAETLGSVTVICADKTGTLTEGKMRVVEALTSINPDIKVQEIKKDLMVKAAALCNDMRDPLEVGMMDWALPKLKNQGAEVGLEALEREYKRVDQIPFDPRWRYIATLHKREEKNLLLVSGAPEEILNRCETAEKYREKWGNKFIGEGKKGRRLVGFAYKETVKNKISNKDVEKLRWLGCLVYEDPVREEVVEALKEAKDAGIKVKVITGDYRFTAEAIVNQLKIEKEDLTANQVMEGSELTKITDEELKKKIDEVVLFARIKPEQKLRIVQVLQEKGEVVAMTGDGVNDAPAIKKADIGIVVEDASAVAKETADMVLLDSNFKTIIAAVEEGRGIFVNIRKIILYLLSDSFTEVILVLLSMLLGLPLPITAAQILWINLVDDGLPDFALTLEPKPDDLMKQKPQGHERSLLDGEIKVLIGLISLVTAVMSLGVFIYYLNKIGDLVLARSMAFTMMGVDSLLYVFSCKSLKEPLWREKLFDNLWLIGAVILGLSFQAAALYTPALQRALKTVGLGAADWAVVIVTSLGVIGVIEGIKFVYNKRS